MFEVLAVPFMCVDMHLTLENMEKLLGNQGTVTFLDFFFFFFSPRFSYLEQGKKLAFVQRKSLNNTHLAQVFLRPTLHALESVCTKWSQSGLLEIDSGKGQFETRL